MKKVLFGLLMATFFAFESAHSQTEYKVITMVESIVPGGLGRSRLIENKAELNIDEYTTERTNGKNSGMGSVKRKDAKIDAFAESKILNLYTLVGLNFQNIASNDAL
ncbi:MAG: hypothetical protein AAF824_17380, partial [Bacteroidota bacterium]